MPDKHGVSVVVLKVTPGIGILCVLLMIIVARDPPRGMAENNVNTHSQSSVKEDMLALLKKDVISSSGNITQMLLVL